MKKVLIGIVLASVAIVSFAGGRDDYRNFQNHNRNHELRNSHPYGHPHVGGSNWVAPLIIGSIAGAIIARESQPVYVHSAPVYIQQPVYMPLPVIRHTACSEWRETQTPDGRIYRERSCYAQ